jgi:uncharacterized surface protein with fasciclin (FAS1) repeats
MPMTYMQLAKELAAQGYTREEFDEAVSGLSGRNSYEVDPNAIIEGDFATSLEEGTTPLQSGPPLEEAGPRSVSVAPLPMMSMPEPQEGFDLPVALQMQREQQRLQVERWRARQIAAEEPSPTEFTYPEQIPAPEPAWVPQTQWKPMRVGGRLDVGGVPGPQPAEEVPSAPYRTMTLEEYAGAAGRPPESLQYPEEYQHMLAATEALEHDPESVYREETAPEPEPEPMTPAMPMRYNIPHPATFEGPAKPSLEGPLPSTLADYMEDKRLIAGGLRSELEQAPSALADYMEDKRLVEGRLEDAPLAAAPGPLMGPEYRGEELHPVRPYSAGPVPPSVAEDIAEAKRKGELREEFYEEVERPEGDPGGYIKAGMDPFDFAGTVLENKSIATWGSAMWERFIQLFEVPVRFAIEGDLRLGRLLRSDEWNSDEDMEYVLFTGQTQTLTRTDREAFERLWDKQDAEVIDAIDETLVDAEAKAALYPFFTNARKSVGNLANGLWDMGISVIGGNIPVAAWKAKSPEDRKRILEDQAHDALVEMFGKGMAAFVIASLANPTAAVEVFPAELSFIMYRPMKSLATKGSARFVKSMDWMLDRMGEMPEFRAPPTQWGVTVSPPAIATAVKRGASAVKRGLADPAYHYTEGGKRFLEETGRESVLAEEAIKEGMDVVARSVAEETAAGRPPEIVKPERAPLTDRQKYLQEIVFESPEEAARLTVVNPEKAALEAGVLDAVGQSLEVGSSGRVGYEGLSATRWPHTPKRQLGYEYESMTVPISVVTGKATRKARKVAEPTRRDPEPTILPEEAMDMIRDLNEIFGEEGAIVRGLVTEEGLAQQVIAAVDVRLANQLLEGPGQKTVVEIVIADAEQAFGKLPEGTKSAMKKTIKEQLEDAAGRRRGEGGSSSVYNPIFEIEGPGGKTIHVNSVQALARAQKNDPVFRGEIQKQLIGYTSRRIGAQAKHKGIQNGVMNTIIRDGDVVSEAAYAAAPAAERTAMRAAALKGGKAIEGHTRLKRKLEKERALPKKEQDAAAIEKMSDQLYEMENGTAQSPGLVDRYLEGIIEKFARDGELPSTWLFGSELELAFNRLETVLPKREMRRLGMLREHLKPRNAQKVYGAKLASEEALMASYFGFTAPSEGAMLAFRRAAAKPLTDITKLMPDRYMSLPLYKVSKLMAQDGGVLPATSMIPRIEIFWRNVKLGKVAGNPGSHVMAYGANWLVQAQRRGDLFVGPKAAGTLVDYMRYKAGLKTVVDPQIYRSLEHSGRVSGAMVKFEIDKNLRRALKDTDLVEIGKGDPWGELMTMGIGKRVYDWWDTMFKIEDGVDQWRRRMEDWEGLPAGTPKKPIEYHFPISRTRIIEAQKINGKMVVDGRVLTDAQFRHMMGRAAMEPGSRVLVDFKDIPLLGVFKRNFPLLDMMLADFSTWRLVTDTFPFLKDGIIGEIMMGATPRGYTSHVSLRVKRAAELATTNLARTMMAATLSERVSGEDNQLIRSALNKYGAASPVFSVSATEDPSVISVADGTRFSVYESVERWLRAAEAIAVTAPSKGYLGDTIREWVGYVEPTATIEIPGEGGDFPVAAPERELMFMLTPEKMSRLSPERRRHLEQSMAYWVDHAKTGGMGRKASLALMYLEGNLFVNFFADMMFETRKEGEMGPGYAFADTLFRSFLPRWATSALYYGLETKREGDIAGYQEALEALTEEERDPMMIKALGEKHLTFASRVSQMVRQEYRAEAVLGALDPALAESPLRRLAQRTLHAPRFLALVHKFDVDLKSKKRTKARKGMKAVGFSFKGTIVEGYIDSSSRAFSQGVADALKIHQEATWAGDKPTAEGSMKYRYRIPRVGAKLKGIDKLFRKILTEEIGGVLARWQNLIIELERKGRQIGPKGAPESLEYSRGFTPEGEVREIPTEGWTEEPKGRKRFEKPEQYYPF